MSRLRTALVAACSIPAMLAMTACDYPVMSSSAPAPAAVEAAPVAVVEDVVENIEDVENVEEDDAPAEDAAKDAAGELAESPAEDTEVEVELIAEPIDEPITGSSWGSSSWGSSKNSSSSSSRTTTPTPEKPTPLPVPETEEDCGNCVALTYDDGPLPGTTDRLLDIFAERGVKASFFMIGENIAAHPELARRVAKEGHTVGNHTYNHPRLPEHPDKTIWREIFATNWEIEDKTGVVARWMRPPYTDYDNRVIEASTDAGLSVTAWDVDTEDWDHKDPERTCNTVLDQARGGSIVVMHDVHPETVDAADCILDGLFAKGLVPVTLDKLVPEPVPGAVYRTRLDVEEN